MWLPAALLILLTTTAQAQEVIGFPRSDFGRIVLSTKQSFHSKLEGRIGQYNNEPISLYNQQSVFARLGRPVGRLDVLTNVRVFPCTAFLISDSYLLTNHHCVPGILNDPRVRRLGATRIEAVQIVLGYVREGIEEDARRFSVSPVPIEQSEELDYAILEVFGQPSREFGTVRLAAADIFDNQPFLIIGHPLGSSQRISREKCASSAPAISGGKLRHKCDTLPGNSGSPVFDQFNQTAIALHHAGSSRNAINYAIPFARIARHSKIVAGVIKSNSNDEDVSLSRARLLSEAARAWQRIKNSRDSTALRAFALRYKGTAFADMAFEMANARDVARKTVDELRAARENETRHAQEARELAKQKTALARQLDELRRGQTKKPERPTSPSQSAVPTDRNELARAIQIELARMGCYQGAMDGEWGPASIRAVEQFRDANGLNLVSVDPTPETLRVVRQSTLTVCPAPKREAKPRGVDGYDGYWKMDRFAAPMCSKRRHTEWLQIFNGKITGLYNGSGTISKDGSFRMTAHLSWKGRKFLRHFSGKIRGRSGRGTFRQTPWGNCHGTIRLTKQ